MTLLGLVGDMMLGDSTGTVGFGLHSRYPGTSVRAPLRGVEDALSGCEIGFGNLECVLVDAGVGRNRLQRDQMRGDPAYASVLRAIGLTVVGVANNHAMQHGVEGFQRTIECLIDAGVRPLGVAGADGWCCEPVVVTAKSGETVGFLGYCLRPRQYSLDSPPFAEGSEQAIAADVRRLRERVTHVVVSLHWGEEFVSEPSEDEVKTASRIAEAGASVIVGHHPHVARPVTTVGGCLVAYSLGNAVSDMVWMPELRRGLAVRVDLSSRPPRAAVRNILTSDSYVASLDGEWGQASSSPLRGLPNSEYNAAIARSLAAQRRRLYSFTLRNIGRYPLAVSSQLLMTTARNKLLALLGR